MSNKESTYNKKNRLLAFTASITLILSLSSATIAQESYKKDFLYRRGTQLMLNGEPYQCASFNSFQLCGCGHDYELFSDCQIDSLFALLPKNIIVRTWATPAFSHRTDFLVEMARKHNIKLLLSLADGRSGCGDIDGAPNGDGSGKIADWYKEGYRKKYLPHVIEMVSKYKDAPEIAMWEIINEPADADWLTIRDFLHHIAAIIKKYDPNHLVESGTFAGWAYGGADNYKALHDSPNIDVGNLHEYDYDYENSNTIESWHFAPCLKAMQELDKVLIVGETGINSGDGDCRTTRSQRCDAMRSKFDIYLQKGAGAVFVWNLARESRNVGLTFGLDDPLWDLILTYPANERNSTTSNKNYTQKEKL